MFMNRKEKDYLKEVEEIGIAWGLMINKAADFKKARQIHREREKYIREVMKEAKIRIKK